MNCHATRAVLDLYAEKRLTVSREKAVSSHLASCAECRSLTTPAAAPIKAPTSDFKTRLAAAIKAERKEAAPRPEPKLELNLWPRDLSGVAFASIALAAVALAIGWSGVPTQFGAEGAELAAGRTP